MPLNTTIRNAHAQAVIDAAGSNAKVNLYNGAVPTSGGTPAGTLLSEHVMSGALGTASAGAITLGTVGNDASGNASGTPTYYRVLTAADVWIGDFPISGFPAIVAGQPVSITNGTITMGNA